MNPLSTGKANFTAATADAHSVTFDRLWAALAVRAAATVTDKQWPPSADRC